MAVPYSAQKSFPIDAPLSAPSSQPPSALDGVLSHPALTPAANLFNRFSAWRASLGLPNPGTVENLQKEVKSTHLTNYIFDGARADLTKVLSAQPAFQVSHSFVLGSSEQPSTYNFITAFATQKTMLQGQIDHDGNLSGRLHHGWSPANASKLVLQLSQAADRSMLHLEHDYTGADFSLNFKALNPSPIDGGGLYFGSYFQSLTKNLALGVETMYQRAATESDIASSYVAKYTGSRGDWVATAQAHPIGTLQTTYWQKLSEKLEVASELHILTLPGRRDAVATLGAKWDLRLASFRAQLDSKGKVSALLEQRFAPSFIFLVSGEIDHFKNAARFGVGVMVESSPLTPEEMGMPPPPF